MDSATVFGRSIAGDPRIIANIDGSARSEDSTPFIETVIGQYRVAVQRQVHIIQLGATASMQAVFKESIEPVIVAVACAAYSPPPARA